VPHAASFEIRPDGALSDPGLHLANASLVEALVVPGSPLVGRTLRDAALRERHGLQGLGLNRCERNILAKLSHLHLRIGDVVLLQGRTTGIAAIAREGLVSVLNPVDEPVGQRPKACQRRQVVRGSWIRARTAPTSCSRRRCDARAAGPRANPACGSSRHFALGG
jgi:hypothetical protein